jgi:hypothetical protein
MVTSTTAVRAVELLEEDRETLLWRVDQFRQLGFEDDAAWALALSDADLGQARNLGRSGCPTELAYEILV